MFSLYYFELKKKTLYLGLSFSLCFLVSSYNFYLLFLLSSFPFLQAFHQKFILTSTLDLLELFWFLLLNFCFFFTLPLFIYQTFCFFKSSFYAYQINLLRLNIILICLSFLVNLFICWVLLTPITLKFLMNWSILNQDYGLFLIEIELKVLNYSYWVLSFQSMFLNFTNLVCLITLQIYYLIELERIYFFMKKYKKIIIFLTVLSLFLFSSSSVLFQFIVISFSWLIFEISFLLLCFKLQNSKYLNANY